MANYKASSVEQDFMFVDEDGNPIESSGENLVYVDETGREIPHERASRMLESGEWIDTRVLYEDKSKKKAFNNMAGEARVRDQIRDEIVKKAYQMALVKDPNAVARNRAEEQAFLKINKPKVDDHAPPQHQPPPHQPPPQQHRVNNQTPTQHHRINNQTPPQQRSNQPPPHQQQQRVNSQQRQRVDEQARHRAEEQARLKAQQQNRARAEEKARAEEHMKQQANSFARNRSRSTEQSHQQQQAQMRSRNATPITPMRLERSNSRGSNNRGKENLMQQQQNKINNSKPMEQGKSKEDQMLSLLKNQLLKKQQELMPADKVIKPNQPIRRDASKILVNKNASYY